MNRAASGSMQWLLLVAAAAVVAGASVAAWHWWQARPAVESLETAGSLSADQRAGAQRFFGRSEEQQARFLAVVEAAREYEKDGADVAQVRGALAGAVAAAAADDADAVDAEIAAAEQVLERTEMLPAGAGVVAGTAEGLSALVDRIAPAYGLGRDLLTEGHAAADKLLGRASREHRGGEIGRAAALVHLAAALLGVEAAAPQPAMPAWFDALADAPSTAAPASQAGDLVALAEAMAASEAPAEPIASLVRKARRELDAGRRGDASFWANVALNAMGMTDESLAAGGGENGAVE